MRLLGRRSGLLYGAPLGLTPAQRAARYGLVAAWNGEDLTDSFGANTLTNNNSATFTAGKLSNAFTLVKTSTQYLSIADNAALSVADVDFALACWVKFTSRPAIAGIMTKDSGAAIREYFLSYDQGTNLFEFGVLNGVSTFRGDVESTTFGALSNGVWYFVMAYYSKVAATIGISVNGGAWDTAATTGAVGDSTSDFNIGMDRSDVGARGLDGQVDAAVMLKSPPGGLTTTLRDEIRNYLYNGGAGRQYPLGWT